MQIGQVLRQGAFRHPDRVAIVEGGPNARVEHTYRSLDARARAVCRGLRDRGLAPGARIGLVAENGVSFLASFFGALYGGISVVPLPVVSAPPEVAFRIEHAKLAAVLSDLPRRPLVDKAIAIARRSVDAIDIDVLADEATDGDDPPCDLPADALAMLLYTSGTTGKPKGACITHASLAIHTAALVHHTLGLGPEDRVLGALPLTHSFGIRMAVLAPLYAGACTVLVGRFDPERTLSVIERESITWIPAVPTMFSAWANLSRSCENRALRWCLSAGAPLPEEIRRAAEAKLGAEIRQGYGLTEATFSTVNAPPDARIGGCVGRPVWGVEVGILGADGRRCAAGEEGEIVVRGQNVMHAYLDDPAATDAVVQGGWLRTGDVGTIDADGRLWVVDRLKDLILRGGHNVYPSEVEDALAGHPAIRALAVVGRPDPHYGEEVVAIVVLHPGQTLTPEALFDWACERIARTKVPRELAIVERLPLGPSGKVLRRELRAMLENGTLSPMAVSQRPAPRT